MIHALTNLKWLSEGRRPGGNNAAATKDKAMTRLKSAATEYIMLAWIPQLAAFAGDETGQDMIEYALVAALLGLGAVVAIKSLSTKIGSAFASIGTSLTTNV